MNKTALIVATIAALSATAVTAPAEARGLRVSRAVVATAIAAGVAASAYGYGSGYGYYGYGPGHGYYEPGYVVYGGPGYYRGW